MENQPILCPLIAYPLIDIRILPFHAKEHGNSYKKISPHFVLFPTQA